ncbi:MAG: alpha/beta fold hydrolase [Bacteroidetes bacterium]|nr:alpha/beta fold hydrolase [Bacteroidota bacterium]
MSKPHLFLLHSALSSSSAFDNLLPLLQGHFQLHLFNFQGHGGSPIPAEGITIDLLVDQLEQEIAMRANDGLPIYALGHSLGGYVALCLALKPEQPLAGIITFGTKFGWNPESAKQEVVQLQPEILLEKAPAFAEDLQQRHAPTPWQALIKAIGNLMLNLGSHPPLNENTLADTRIPCLIIRGEKDRIAGAEETAQATGWIPGAQSITLPETPHQLERLNPELLANAILTWKKF